MEIQCGKVPSGSGYALFTPSKPTKLKFKCETCKQSKGKRGGTAPKSWTTINGTTIILYKVDL